MNLNIRDIKMHNIIMNLKRSDGGSISVDYLNPNIMRLRHTLVLFYPPLLDWCGKGRNRINVLLWTSSVSLKRSQALKTVIKGKHHGNEKIGKKNKIAATASAIISRADAL